MTFELHFCLEMESLASLSQTYKSVYNPDTSSLHLWSYSDTPRGLSARQLLPLCCRRPSEYLPRGGYSWKSRSGDGIEWRGAAIPA